MKAICSAAGWYFVHRARSAAGEVMIDPICAFGVTDGGDTVALIADGGDVVRVDASAGAIRQLHQLTEEQASTAGIYALWALEVQR